MTPQTMLSLDFETYSRADLRRAGVYRYARDPSTRVMCLAYAFGDDPVQIWRTGDPLPTSVLRHVAKALPVRAWNATFELEIWNNVLVQQCGLDPHMETLAPEQTHDTMADAAYYGLPLSLDAASKAAGTGHLKDKTGHGLMLRMCRPRAVDPNGTVHWWHEEDPSKFDELCRYCIQDVVTERAIAATLLPLPDRERAIWLLDNRINARGVHFDIAAINALDNVALAAKADLNEQIKALTNATANSINSAALLGWLQDQGYPATDIRKDTVAARLADPDCTGLERTGLEIRAAGAKTSAAKLSAMTGALMAVPGHALVGLIRGMLQHYGAMRTGRWAGRLVQPQNLPRPDMKHGAIEVFIELLSQGDPGLNVIEALFGPAMTAVASSLRACIIAHPGNLLVVADFSQIEARVIAWLAGATKVLDAFRHADSDPDAPDIYEIAAAGIYGVHPEAVTKDQRQIGKVAVLALGFGGGKGAFQVMAAAYGVTMTDAEADQIKVAWRADNPEIVRLWYDLEAAAKDVVKGGSTKTVGSMRVGMWGAHLVIRLPSGRCLFYRLVRLDPDDDGRIGITYMGLNQYTRQWERLRTYGGKLVENVTQATARDCMADVMLEADARGHAITLTVHDELLTEAPEDMAPAMLDDLLGIMAQPTTWAAGLPTKGDGWAGRRYRK
jgi:DNA polymerase